MENVNIPVLLGKFLDRVIPSGRILSRNFSRGHIRNVERDFKNAPAEELAKKLAEALQRDEIISQIDSIETGKLKEMIESQRKGTL
jgi:hypothetical protein